MSFFVGSVCVEPIEAVKVSLPSDPSVTFVDMMGESRNRNNSKIIQHHMTTNSSYNCCGFPTPSHPLCYSPFAFASVEVCDFAAAFSVALSAALACSVTKIMLSLYEAPNTN